MKLSGKASNYQKKFLPVLFLLFAISFLHPEPDKGTFLATSPFDVSNFYIDTRPIFRLPFIFFYQEARVMSPVGGGFSLGGGYNLDGWLFGLQAGYGGYGKGMNQHVDLLNSHIFTVGVSAAKIIGKAMIPAFPQWFSFAPEIGTGVSIIRSSFFQPESTGSGKTLFTEQGISPYLSLGILFMFPVHKAITPYVGIGNTLQFVFDSVVYTPSVDFGVRLYPVLFKSQ